MEKQQYENQKITIYWWNFGKKTLDFKGSYKDYLQKRDIKVSPFIRRGFWGYRFTVCVDSNRIVYETPRNNYQQSCDEIIKMFLSVMGDKAKLITPYHEYFINWR
jgi:hypothetical protein